MDGASIFIRTASETSKTPLFFIGNIEKKKVSILFWDLPTFFAWLTNTLQNMFRLFNVKLEILQACASISVSKLYKFSFPYLVTFVKKLVFCKMIYFFFSHIHHKCIPYYITIFYSKRRWCLKKQYFLWEAFFKIHMPFNFDGIFTESAHWADSV